MSEETQYRKEIDILFNSIFNTELGVVNYMKDNAMNVETLSDVIVFIRKQARFSMKYENKIQTENIIKKCEWVGKNYVPELCKTINPNLGLEVISLMVKKEEEEKHFLYIQAKTIFQLCGQPIQN